MPEIATQCEIKDTTRSVRIQCRRLEGYGDVIEARRVKYQVRNARPRLSTNPRTRPFRSPATTLTGVNAERRVIETRRKCLGTQDGRYVQVILKRDSTSVSTESEKIVKKTSK